MEENEVILPDGGAVAETQTEKATVAETVTTEEATPDTNVETQVVETEVSTETIEPEKSEEVVDVKEELSEEHKEIVQEIEKKEESQQELNPHEKLVNDLLDELQKEKLTLAQLRLERDAAVQTADKWKEEIVGQRSKPWFMEVPTDLLPVVNAYNQYAQNRSDESGLIKALEAVYNVVDTLGWPSMRDSVNSHLEYKKRTISSVSGNTEALKSLQNDDVVEKEEPKLRNGITVNQAYRPSFTNRTF